MKTIKYRLFYWYIKKFNKKYKLHLAKNLDEINAVLNFRKKIYHEELKYRYLKNNFKDITSSDNYIFYVGNVKDILGTITINTWLTDDIPSEFLKKYDLSSPNLYGISRVGEFRYFMLKPELRNSFLGVSIITQLYNYFEALNYPDIFFGNSLLNLINSYINLGSFFYTHKLIYDEYGDITLPFAIPTFDLKYLKKQNYLFYILSKKYLINFEEKLIQRGYNKRHGKDLAKNFNLIKKEEFFSLKGSDIDSLGNSIDEFIRLILKYTNDNDRLIVTVEADNNIIPMGEIDYSLYIIINGEFEVIKKGKSVAVLKSQDIFGEVALFTDLGARTASIRSLKTGKIMMIKYKFFKQLERKHPKIACQLYFLFCKKLSRKLINTTQELVIL